jgi:hypothetical protein
MTEVVATPDPNRPWLLAEIGRRSTEVGASCDHLITDTSVESIDAALAKIADLQALVLRLDAGRRGSKVVALVDRRVPRSARP